MTSTSQEHLMLILQQAAGEPIGLVLRTNDPAKARQRLYAARAKAGDPDLAQLQIRMGFADGELVICKGGLLALPPPAKKEDIDNDQG